MCRNEEALDKRYAPTSLAETVAGKADPFGRTAAFLGDSISDNSSGATTGIEGDPTKTTRARGYIAWALMLLGARLRWIKNSDARWEFGAAGLTVQQIIDQGHVANVIARNRVWCVEQSGTNSIAAGVTAAEVFAQRKSMWNQLLAAGIRVMVCTLLPRSSLTTTQSQAVRDHNNLVRNYAATTRNVVLCDWSTPMTNPSTGLLLAGTTYDGLHPDGVGASIMGQVMAAAFDPFVPKCSPLFDPWYTWQVPDSRTTAF